MPNGFSGFVGAIAAWLCLAPVAFASVPLSMPSTPVPASSTIHCIANLSVFLIWIAGGILLAVGGLLAFAPTGVRARRSGSLSKSMQIYRTTAFDLAWTVIPVLVVLVQAIAR